MIYRGNIVFFLYDMTRNSSRLNKHKNDNERERIKGLDFEF